MVNKMKSRIVNSFLAVLGWKLEDFDWKPGVFEVLGDFVAAGGLGPLDRLRNFRRDHLAHRQSSLQAQ